MKRYIKTFEKFIQNDEVEDIQNEDLEQDQSEQTEDIANEENSSEQESQEAAEPVVNSDEEEGRTNDSNLSG